MSNEQRKLFAEKLLDLANIVAGALVFGQFVSGQVFSILPSSLESYSLRSSTT